jgi:hypothetical protein
MTMHQSVNVRSRQYQVEFDQGRHHRAKIGYVLLATEQTIQDDVMRLRPDGVGVHITRAEIPDSITNETLAAQADLLAELPPRCCRMARSTWSAMPVRPARW